MDVTRARRESGLCVQKLVQTAWVRLARMTRLYGREYGKVSMMKQMGQETLFADLLISPLFYGRGRIPLFGSSCTV